MRLREVVVSGKVRQDLSRPRISRQALRHPGRHPRQERGAEKESPHPLPETGVHLLAEIVEDLPVRSPGQSTGLRASRSLPLQEQRDPRRPPVGPAVRLPDRFPRNAPSPPEPGDPARLLGRQAQILPPEHPDLPVDPLPGELRRGIAPADQDRRNPCRKAGQPFPKQPEERGSRGGVLAVVEHQDRPGAEPPEEILEEPVRERIEARLELRGQVRQGRPLPRRRLLSRQPQVIEEGRGIPIPLVDFIPDAADASSLHVSGYRHGLPAPRRTGHPRDRNVSRLIQQTIEAFAGVGTWENGPGDLDDGSPLDAHVIPSSRDEISSKEVGKEKTESGSHAASCGHP